MSDPNDIDFEADAQPVGDLKALTAKVEELKNKMGEAEILADELKDVAKQIAYIEGTEIPDMMDACGVKELVLPSGEKLVVKPIVKASLPTQTSINNAKDENKKAELEHRLDQGLQWLRDNGAEELIKNTIIVEFSRGQDNIAGDFEGKAAELGLPAQRNTSVAHGTLSKFCADKIAKGEDVPHETLGIYCGRKATVKKAR